MPDLRLVLADLDDTLMSTARKQADTSACRLVALNKKGEPSSWQSPAQAALWQWLGQFGEVVPVTARNRAGLDRVDLPLSDHAVWNHGASLAIHGVLDQEWQAVIQGDLDALERDGIWETVRATLETWLATRSNVPPTVLRNNPHPEFQDRRFQMEIKQAGVGQYVPDLAARLQAAVGDRLWVYPHYDVVAVLPQRVRKEHAVARLLAALQPAFTVGAGDSPTDLPFMRLCDSLVMPSESLMARLMAHRLDTTQHALSTRDLS